MEGYGYETDACGHVAEPDDPLARPLTSQAFVRHVHPELLPKSCIPMIDTLLKMRRQASHMVCDIEEADIQKCACAFRFLVGWFTLEFADEDGSQELPDYLEGYNTWSREELSSGRGELSNARRQEILLEKMQDLEKGILDIRQTQARMEGKLDEIRQQLYGLTDLIRRQQTDTQKRLLTEDSEQARDAILREFSDRCTECILENIMDSVHMQADREKYMREEENLKLTLGQNT